MSRCQTQSKIRTIHTSVFMVGVLLQHETRSCRLAYPKFDMLIIAHPVGNRDNNNKFSNRWCERKVRAILSGSYKLPSIFGIPLDGMAVSGIPNVRQER